MTERKLCNLCNTRNMPLCYYARVLLGHVVSIYADSSIKRLLKVSLEERIHEGMEANLMKRIFEFLTWMRVEWKWKTIDNVDCNCYSLFFERMKQN